MATIHCKVTGVICCGGSGKVVTDIPDLVTCKRCQDSSKHLIHMGRISDSAQRDKAVRDRWYPKRRKGR